MIHNWREAGWAEALRVPPIFATELVQDMTPIDPKRIELIDPIVAQILRGKSPAQRVDSTLSTSLFVRTVVTAAVRDRHKDWNADKVQAEVARRILRGSS